MTKSNIIESIRNGLIVSCQASAGEPLCDPTHICALALSAQAGGACALRLEGADNIKSVRQKTMLPIIGLTKTAGVDQSKRLDCVYITGTFADAKICAEAGADIVACDATFRRRPDGSSFSQLVDYIHKDLGKLVLADASTFAEGKAAFEAQADIVSTTLSGYTRQTYVNPEDSGPDLSLLKDLCQAVDCPVILEGRVWLPEQVAQAFALGAFAVVVGSAITRPQLITRRFVKQTPLHLQAR